MRCSKYLILGIFFIISCDKGIAPEPENIQPGFSGKVIFLGEWDESVKRTHIILFKENLTDSTKFNIGNLAYISEEIPFGVDEYEFSTLENSVIQNIIPGGYEYLAVIQSSEESISFRRSDWKVAGLYSDNNQIPKILFIPENIFFEDINILVDFDNPPPQPPGGKE